MRGSKAAAEVAALEGLMSSPDTQECNRIFQESLGCGFDSQQTIGECTVIIDKFQPQLSRSGASLSVSKLVPVISSVGIFSCAQQAKPFANLSAPSYLQLPGQHSRGISVRDTDHTLSESLHPREDSCAEGTDVPQVVNSALDESFERTSLSSAHGIATTERSTGGKMEDFISPLDGSDGSNLSPTQENDPAVYIRLQQELMAIAAGSQNSSPGPASTKQGLATNAGSVPSAQDTGVTYAVNDTGHLTLDYHHPPSSPSLHDSFDQPEVGDISNARLKPQHINVDRLQPETPAQARLAIENLGTVMRPSQMFAETQPSPGSRDRHLLPPSSSRPSPALFNQYQSPKQPTSSPLARRTGQRQVQRVDNLDISSSPERPQIQEDSHRSNFNSRPLTDCKDVLKNARGKSSASGRLLHQINPEAFNVYTTLQESQERRKPKETPIDHDDKSSYDGFSDDGQEPTRRARRKKERAAKELAVIGTTTPGSDEKDFVEIPSTSHCRRRSLAENYEAQCSGFDARDTQPDATILDSQSAPEEHACSSTDKPIFAENNFESTQSQSKLSQYDLVAGLAFCNKSCQDASWGQLPGLDHNEQSQATDSDREGSRPPERGETLHQSAFSIAELRTPAVQKKLPYVDGGPVVPETSPPEPHLQRFGDIVVQTPLLSAEEIDDGFNPFTQDTEFENLLQSPSPQRRFSSRIGQQAVSSTITNSRGASEADQMRKKIEVPKVHLSQPANEQFESPLEMRSNPKDTASESASAYVTAPTGLTSESLQIPELLSNIELDSISVEFRVEDKKLLSESGSQAPRICSADKPGDSGETDLPRTELHNFQAEMMQDSTTDLASLAEEKTNNLQRVDDHLIRNDTSEILESNHQKPPPAKKLRLTTQTSTKPSKQIKKSLEKVVNLKSDALTVEPPAVFLNRLRPATQLRGSSRALRRLLEDGNAAPSTPVPPNTISALPIKKLPRSSRPSSVSSNEKAQSTGSEGIITPSLSTRRRTLSSHALEHGIFEGMAFSVTYNANREDEKQHVLDMIRNNGGRVLEKGFDELFDMNSFQRSSFAKNNESSTVYISNDLTLTADARTIGFACVIADDHSRRVKFMQALALGLPCISGRWIEHCVARKEILGWEQYHLAAGESSFLGGAVRSRNLQSYSADTANFVGRFEQRPRLLTGKSILVITGKGKVEERRKPYFFLTQALGARRVKHVQNNQEARKFLLEAELNQEEWNWVYVGEDEDEAEKAIFGFQMAQPKKRKRTSQASDEAANAAPPPKKVRIISDEYVIQSLILGKFIEE